MTSQKKFTRLQRLCKELLDIEVDDQTPYQPILWLTFSPTLTDPACRTEFTWKIGFQRAGDGIRLFDGSQDQTLGFIDLYHRHETSSFLPGLPPFSQYIIDSSADRDDNVGVAKYLGSPWGTIVVFDNTEVACQGHGERGWPYYGYPKEETG